MNKSIQVFSLFLLSGVHTVFGMSPAEKNSLGQEISEISEEFSLMIISGDNQGYSFTPASSEQERREYLKNLSFHSIIDCHDKASCFLNHFNQAYELIAKGIALSINLKKEAGFSQAFNQNKSFIMPDANQGLEVSDANEGFTIDEALKALVSFSETDKRNNENYQLLLSDYTNRDENISDSEKVLRYFIQERFGLSKKTVLAMPPVKCDEFLKIMEKIENNQEAPLQIIKIIIPEDAGDVGALSWAIESGYFEIVRLLITILKNACYDSNNEQVFIQHINSLEGSFLRLATRDGYFEIVRLLLDTLKIECGDDRKKFIDIINESEAMRGAVCKGYFDIVKLLIETLKNEYSATKDKQGLINLFLANEGNPLINLSLSSGHNQITTFLLNTLKIQGRLMKNFELK